MHVLLNLPEPVPIHRVPNWFDVVDCAAHRPPAKSDSMVGIFDRSMSGMYGHQGLYLAAVMIVVHSNMTNGIHLNRMKMVTIMSWVCLESE